VWPAILAAAAILTCARWELVALGMTPTRAARQEWVSVLGVSLLVLAAAFYGPVRSALQHRTLQWLGALSFSLYLVHEPIVIAVRFLMAEQSPWLSIMISVPLAVVVAICFARWVERPLQDVARRAGRRLESTHPQPRRAVRRSTAPATRGDGRRTG
jgi:peptidoglycan/LPS O-acetylase OafA/YrhL